jgi:DNA mismatch endonuclease (patch repair protein)
MSAIKSKDTRPEIALRKALWRKGLRYRVNHKKLPGKPDIVFIKAKLAIFCDGDYWHGHNWAVRGLGSLDEELSNYSEFWANKIRQNMKRDQEVNEQLKDMDWTVMRVWESDINTNIEECVARVIRKYKEKL